MGEALIVTAGGMGDVAPYTGLGVGLRAAGFDVSIATHDAFAGAVTGAGLGFRSLPENPLRLGLPDGGSEPADSAAYQTFDTVRTEFGAGASGPIIAVAELDAPIADGDETALLAKQADIGEEFVDVMVAVKETEHAAYQSVISSWEREHLLLNV